jgi:hypothetical protein
MNVDTTESGWKRFLRRIRKFWEAPPQQNPVPIRSGIEDPGTERADHSDSPNVSSR